MTIEIHNAELEAILRQRLGAGRFASVEDMLLDALKQDRSGQVAPLEEAGKKALWAAHQIRELRKGVQLDLPEGMSMRQFIHLGHKY